MRKDSWNDTRIIFWDEVYDVLSQDVDKKQLKEKRLAVSTRQLNELAQGIEAGRIVSDQEINDVFSRAEEGLLCLCFPE